MVVQLILRRNQDKILYLEFKLMYTEVAHFGR